MRLFYAIIACILEERSYQRLLREKDLLWMTMNMDTVERLISDNWAQRKLDALDAQ